jgi:hypothetical protein
MKEMGVILDKLLDHLDAKIANQPQRNRKAKVN